MNRIMAEEKVPAANPLCWNFKRMTEVRLDSSRHMTQKTIATMGIADFVAA